MGRVKQKITSGLQWNLKWVRIMLITSVVAVIGLVLLPDFNKHKSQMSPVQEYVIDDSVTVAERPASEIVPRILPQPRPVPRSIDSQVKNIIKEQPKKEPFDWKGTITWAIGAMNGLILIVLNIKNLVLKKK